MWQPAQLQLNISKLRIGRISWPHSTTESVLLWIQRCNYSFAENCWQQLSVINALKSRRVGLAVMHTYVISWRDDCWHRRNNQTVHENWIKHVHSNKIAEMQRQHSDENCNECKPKQRPSTMGDVAYGTSALHKTTERDRVFGTVSTIKVYYSA